MPLNILTLNIIKIQHNDTQHIALSITAIIIVTLGKIAT